MHSIYMIQHFADAIRHIHVHVHSFHITCTMYIILKRIDSVHSTVDQEIFAFKYFRVINVRVSNFHHKVQEVKIIHGVFYFRVLNFC